MLDFNSRNRFDVKSDNCFAATILHLDQRRLEDTGDRLNIDLGNLGIIEFAAPYPVNNAKLEQLHSIVKTTKVAAQVHLINPAMSNSLLELEADIYRIVAECLHSKAPGSTVPAATRLKVFRRSITYIDAHLGDALTIADICRASSTSMRTLQRVFLEQLGVTPKRYIQLARLMHVREELIRRGQQQAIAEIAHSWGFWHMSQFANDYRRVFGELPSETRKNAA